MFDTSTHCRTRLPIMGDRSPHWDASLNNPIEFISLNPDLFDEGLQQMAGETQSDEIADWELPAALDLCARAANQPGRRADGR